MIGYVRGTVSHCLQDHCFIDVQGVGYRVFISTATRGKLNIGKETMLFTYLNVRDDAMQLFGFGTQEEYDLFLRLISVSGIGPKVALGILSAISVEPLCQAISQKKITVLTKLPGIGKKTAERLILELHDKLGAISGQTELTQPSPESVFDLPGDTFTEAGQALAALGYSQAEYMPLLRKAGAASTVEEIVRFVLKEFARRS